MTNSRLPVIGILGFFQYVCKPIDFLPIMESKKFRLFEPLNNMFFFVVVIFSFIFPKLVESWYSFIRTYARDERGQTLSPKPVNKKKLK